METTFKINPNHKKPYFVISNKKSTLNDSFCKAASKDLDIPCTTNNFSNKTKKHFGFVYQFLKRPLTEEEKEKSHFNFHCAYKYEERIEIHDEKKLFAFMLKHGL